MDGNMAQTFHPLSCQYTASKKSLTWCWSVQFLCDKGVTGDTANRYITGSINSMNSSDSDELSPKMSKYKEDI
jgi:hypothetical protein